MTNESDLMQSARAYVDEVWEDVINDIDRLVQVESVEDKAHAEPGKPFGPAPYEALTRALAIAERLGLSTHDCEGYVGYGDVPGESSKYLATIAHADIVPLGTGWNFDPLHVTRKDGYLLGRGVLDDKGPLVLSLYAAGYFARKVRDEGKPLPYTLRCIVGTNEETGMEDVDYYLEHFDQPAFCFTPDAVFPLICGEKGRFYAAIASAEFDSRASRIVSMDGGTVANAVPGQAQALVRANASDLAARPGIELQDAGQDEFGEPLVRVHATGKGGHASMPEGTVNAIALLVDYLVEQGLCGDDVRGFLDFERVLLADSRGEALGIAATDDLFDPLTCVGGTIRTEQTDKGVRFVQTMDVRYPKSTSGDAIAKVVQGVAEARGCALVETDDAVPFYISPDSDEIRTLVATYNEVTGREAEAFTIGGGTYARHFERAAAFGPDDPTFPAPSWVGIEHGADEGVAEDSLKRALLIYIVSIARLMRLSL
jgi:succinyl-diaminopimelate desuccinylase